MRRLLPLFVGLFVTTAAQAEWKEAQSRHFRVYSQGSEADLRESITQLEKYEFMLRTVSGSSAKASPVRLKVYLMPTMRDVQSTMGIGGSDGVAGYYTASSRGPIAVSTRKGYKGGSQTVTRDGARNGGELGPQAVLLHEYAHHFMFQHFPAAYPSWYSEGFAEYYGTTRFLPGNVIEVGNPAEHRYRSFAQNEWLPLDRLLTAKSYSDVGGDIGRLYAEGWLLVHYLHNSPARKGQLKTYLSQLNQGTDLRRATDLAFGVGARELDAELRRYARQGRINALSLPFKPIDVGTIAVRTLSPAEDALIESDISLGRGVYVSEAKRFAASVRSAARQFPNDAYALGLLAEAERAAGNEAEASAAVDAWLVADPASARAKTIRAQLALDRLQASKSTDSRAWESVRAPILAAHKAQPNDAYILEAYYDSFAAQRLAPPLLAQNALYLSLIHI